MDYKIMNNLNDKDLVNLCQTNKKADEYCNDQTFWLNRIMQKYPEVPLEVLKRYKGDRPWSDYYIHDLRNLIYSQGVLGYAMLAGRLDHVIILLNAGYRPQNPQTAAGLATANVEIVKYFIDHGIPIDINKALQVASREGHLPSVKYLLEKGADVHYNLESPLKLATGNRQLEIVKYLVEHGADISIDNYYVVRLAGLSRNQDMIDYFVSRGAQNPLEKPLYGAW